MPIFAIFGHFLAIFGRFGPFLDREHQKQCNCNLLGATGPTNYINMVSNGYLEIWSVSDPKTNSGAKQDPKLTWGGQNWSFCTLCSPTNLFYTKNVNSEMVTSKSYFLAWNRPEEEILVPDQNPWIQFCKNICILICCLNLNRAALDGKARAM